MKELGLLDLLAVPILQEFPKTIKDFTSVMKKGKMQIEITTPEIEPVLKKLNKISNRLSFSIVLLSFSIILVGIIIGASLSGQTYILLQRLPVMEIGFGIATAMFLLLLYSILNQEDFETDCCCSPDNNNEKIVSA
jgi:ubiquinone biosynthesis protein